MTNNNKTLTLKEKDEILKELHQQMPLGDYCSLKDKTEQAVSTDWKDLYFDFSNYFGLECNLEGSDSPYPLFSRSNVNGLNLWVDKVTTYHKPKFGDTFLAAIELWKREGGDSTQGLDHLQINLDPTLMTLIAVSWLNSVYSQTHPSCYDQKYDCLRDLADKTRQF